MHLALKSTLCCALTILTAVCPVAGSTTTKGMCANLTMENGVCEMKPQTYPSSDDVYMNMCPCGKYLTCGMSDDQEMVMCLSNSESDMSEITYEVVMD